MSSQMTESAGAAERVNELYWHSGRTVDQIAEELGIGRNSLYAALRPIEADESCPACHRVLVFTNRTSRASGTAVCESCGVTTYIGRESEEASGERAMRNGTRPARPSGLHRFRPTGSGAVRMARLGGAVLLGALIGGAAGQALRG